MLSPTGQRFNNQRLSRCFVTAASAAIERAAPGLPIRWYTSPVQSLQRGRQAVGGCPRDQNGRSSSPTANGSALAGRAANGDAAASTATNLLAPPAFGLPIIDAETSP